MDSTRLQSQPHNFSTPFLLLLTFSYNFYLNYLELNFFNYIHSFCFFRQLFLLYKRSFKRSITFITCLTKIPNNLILEEKLIENKLLEVSGILKSLKRTTYILKVKGRSESIFEFREPKSRLDSRAKIFFSKTVFYNLLKRNVQKLDEKTLFTLLDFDNKMSGLEFSKTDLKIFFYVSNNKG